jgi:hypothetical protein
LSPFVVVAHRSDILAKLLGFDGAYLRFTGDLRIDRLEDGQVVETAEDKALWEEMYFGRNRE